MYIQDMIDKDNKAENVKKKSINLVRMLSNPFTWEHKTLTGKINKDVGPSIKHS
jgi:hypothetical protein